VHIPHISVINMIVMYGSSNGYMTVGLDDCIAIWRREFQKKTTNCM